MSGAAPAQKLRSSRLERRPSARVLGNLAGALDRTLPVPLGVQLRGLVEYGIACGELPPGTRLPSVRELAEAGGVAPMTVSGVYAELRDAGLIATRPGAGTFVAEPTADAAGTRDAMRRLERRVDGLIFHATSMNLEAGDIVAIVNARIARLRARGTRPLRLVMVGVFRDATEAYAADIARQLGERTAVEAMTLDDLRAAGGAVDGADLYVTLANRRQEVETLVQAARPVVSVSFIPAEATRTRLAAVDPVARLGILSVFPEFLALMKPGVLRYTPHVRGVEAALVDDPRLDEYPAAGRRGRLRDRRRAGARPLAAACRGDRVPACARSSRRRARIAADRRAAADRNTAEGLTGRRGTPSPERRLPPEVLEAVALDECVLWYYGLTIEQWRRKSARCAESRAGRVRSRRVAARTPGA